MTFLKGHEEASIAKYASEIVHPVSETAQEFINYCAHEESAEME